MVCGSREAQPSLRAVVAGLIHGTAEFFSTPDNPRGCLLIQGALACSTDAEPVKQMMIDWRKSGEAALKKRLQQAQSEGELPAEIQPADFARYVSSVMAGLGVQAANGATRAELRRVAAIALLCIETFGVLQAANLQRGAFLRRGLLITG